MFVYQSHNVMSLLKYIPKEAFAIASFETREWEEEKYHNSLKLTDELSQLLMPSNNVDINDCNACTIQCFFRTPSLAFWLARW